MVFDTQMWVSVSKNWTHRRTAVQRQACTTNTPASYKVTLFQEQFLQVYLTCSDSGNERLHFRRMFVCVCWDHVLTTCRMVGLQPIMKGKLRKPLMRWAIRTGNSFWRYLALLWNTHTKMTVGNRTVSNNNIFLQSQGFMWPAYLPGCGVHREISQNTAGWLGSVALTARRHWHIKIRSKLLSGHLNAVQLLYFCTAVA